MRVNQLLGMGACFAMLALTGCMDKDVYDPGKDPTVLKPESEYFDFTTTTNVAFEVNYGEIGSNALIEIFTEYPISYNETGSFVIQGNQFIRYLRIQKDVSLAMWNCLRLLKWCMFSHLPGVFPCVWKLVWRMER